jgi:MFS transporter, MHS family, citrate/tricarballylate:H+ symporter
VFGGAAQFVAAWLVAKTGNPLAPAWYMLSGVIVGLAAMLCLQETAPVRIGRSMEGTGWKQGHIPETDFPDP